MSTRYDILTAKDNYNKHIADHKCRPGFDACSVRIALLLAWLGGSKSAAGRWGAEPGDDARQRDQYNELHAA